MTNDQERAIQNVRLAGWVLLALFFISFWAFLFVKSVEKHNASANAPASARSCNMQCDQSRPLPKELK